MVKRINAPIPDEMHKAIRVKTRACGGGLGVPAPRERKRMNRGKLKVVTVPMSDIRMSWETAKKKTGIDPGFHFHDLRHVFASHRRMVGIDDCSLTEAWEHSYHRMTRRYAHLTPEHKRKALPQWKERQKSAKNMELENERARPAVPQLLEVAGG